MISVGIDVSKEKSTVCVLKPYGEVVMPPKDVQHTESELAKLVNELQKLQEEVRVVISALCLLDMVISLEIPHVTIQG